MPAEKNDAYRAGRLIQWGLRTRARPVQEPEYLELIRQYFDSSEFRTAVRHTADGLGLKILDATEHGLFLSPIPDSVFALKPADFRPGHSSVDDRLLVGLVQIAVAATIFPRQRDLEEPAHVVRQPVTVEEVDANIRMICDGYAEAAKAKGDIAANESLRGMEEAWRIYLKRVPVAQTKGGGVGHKTTHRLIRQTLDRLCELGCFTHEGTEHPAYRPTMRYQVAVKELAAEEVFRRVQEALSKGNELQGES